MPRTKIVCTMLAAAPALAVVAGFLRPGQKVVITAEIPKGVAASTNLIKAAVAR